MCRDEQGRVGCVGSEQGRVECVGMSRGVWSV